MRNGTVTQAVQPDRATEIERLGARYKAMRRANLAHNVRVERRLADRPGGNRGRRATDRKATV